jgi:hypothetical protein
MNTLFDMTTINIECACDDGMTKIYDALEFVNHNATLFADDDLPPQLAQLLQRGYAALRMTKAQPARSKVSA